MVGRVGGWVRRLSFFVEPTACCPASLIFWSPYIGFVEEFTGIFHCVPTWGLNSCKQHHHENFPN